MMETGHATVVSLGQKSYSYGKAGVMAMSTPSVPRVSALICSETDSSTENLPFGLVGSLIDDKLWTHYSTTIPATEPCRAFSVAIDEPEPLGRYERGDQIEWNDILPLDTTIRCQFPGPFDVWDWIPDPSRYQGALFDVKDGADDGFICTVLSKIMHRQKTLVLVDWRNEKILFAPPGFFRHCRSN